MNTYSMLILQGILGYVESITSGGHVNSNTANFKTVQNNEQSGEGGNKRNIPSYSSSCNKSLQQETAGRLQ